MKKPIKYLSVFVASAVFYACVSPPKSVSEQFPEGFDGRWKSSACELRPQPGENGTVPWYLKRDIVFSGERIDAHFTNYADPNCETPLVDLKFGGRVNVQGPSKVREGAMNVNLIIDDYLKITPRTEEFAGFLNSAKDNSCGEEPWTVGTEQNVYETGCSVMGVAPSTPNTEYEVLYMAANKLYFGARPVTGFPLAQETDRPKALQIPLDLVSGNKTQQVGIDDLRQPAIVELVTFKQKDGVAAADVEAMLQGYTIEMNKFDTLLYRTIGHDGQGNWTCVNYWTSLEDMKTLNADAQNWPSLKQFGQLVDSDTVSIVNYEIKPQ
ncbi:MAG: hypothetical protein AB4372_26580 [Xenococcus sp. (in: cyanobacteria)]